MADSDENQNRTERFIAAAHAFDRKKPRRYTKLIPFQDGIVELWEKGASLLLIRELLSTVNVSVSPLTISKFLADIGVPSRQRRTAKATKRMPQSKTKTIIQQSPLEPPITEAAKPSEIRRQSNTELQGSTPADVRTSNTLQPEPIPPLARQRIRGPRIANPATI